MAVLKEKKATNIALLSNDRRTVATLGQVTSMEMYNAEKEYHPEGLYSNEIFGKEGSATRRKRHGWIDLKTNLLHPKALLEVGALKELYKGIMAGKDYAIWNAKEKDFERADIISGETGYAFFMKHFKEIKFKKTRSHKRNLVISFLDKYRETGALLNFLIVLPAGLRELTEDQGRPVEDEITPLYRKVLAATNVIDDSLRMKNDPLLDQTRWSLQRKVGEIWDLLMQILHGNGKTGFWRSKWASRRVSYATSNVISALDPAGLAVNSPRSYDLTETLFGVFQFMKGTAPIMFLHQMPNGIASRVISSGGEMAPLIDMETLQPKDVNLTEKSISRWCTEAGREGLIDGFEQLHVRHKPIIIDGHYLALVFKDDTGARVVYSSDEVPENIREKGTITPITWGEYFYLELHSYKDEARALITRYPVATDGSTYPSVPYLRSTMAAKIRYKYDQNWNVNDTDVWEEFPNTEDNESWFNTMSVSQYYLENLGADHDGDKTQALFVTSKEAVKEIDAALDSNEHYLDTDGSLRNSYGVETLERVFRSFTGFL